MWGLYTAEFVSSLIVFLQIKTLSNVKKGLFLTSDKNICLIFSMKLLNCTDSDV